METKIVWKSTNAVAKSKFPVIEMISETHSAVFLHFLIEKDFFLLTLIIHSFMKRLNCDGKGENLLKI